MMNSFEGELNLIVEQIKGMERRQVSFYIHCSKLNDLFRAIRQIPALIAQEKKKHKCGTKEQASFSNIQSTLMQISELTMQCMRETCVQFLLNKSIRTVRKEIKQIRASLEASFEQLKLPAIAQVVKISSSDLKSQDMVDNKRISQILYQISQKNRSDAAENLALRFKSLKKLGINVDQNEKMVLTIPDLPANLQLVIKHEDVKFIKEIGQGQSGSVHLGELNGKEVAVKVLHRRSLNPMELESFQREIFVLSNLSHPALLKMFGYTEEPPFLMVTEYMANGSLFSVLRKKPEMLTPTIRTLIAMDVARGLEFLHGRGIIHRDMKSLNVLLNANYRAKIGDFGMVRLQSKGIKTGMIGTAHWMAPEVLMSCPTYDSKVDVYSFGIVLWELLTGDLPYKDMNPAQVISAVISQQLRPPIPDDAPPKLAELIRKCWDADPAQRPSMTRVVMQLSERHCHFLGTDEVIFATEAGVMPRHKSTNSQQVSHRRRRKDADFAKSESIDLLDPVTLIQSINETHGSSKATMVKALLDMLSEKTEAEAAAKVGGCSIIASILDEHSPLSDYALGALVKCRTPAIFDVVVLKALLGYAVVENEAMRSKALSALIIASDMRFEFLCSAPSFLVQLFGFLSKPLQPQMHNTLLQLGRKLLNNLEDVPETVTAQLLWAMNNLTPILIPSIVSCLSLTLKSDEGKRGFDRENMSVMMRDFKLYEPALTSYAEGETSLPQDQFFASLVFGARSDPLIFSFLAKLAASPRFSLIVTSMLPVGGNTKEAATIYRPLITNRNLLPQLQVIPEFYACASFFVANGEYELVCNALKFCDVDPEIVLQSRLCSLVASALNNAQNDDHMILLMAAIYSISKAVYSDDFQLILPRLYSLLFSTDTAIRMPSFLAIVAIGMHSPKPVDYARILPLAARYVNCDSSMTRDIATTVIRDHICDAGENLNQVLSAFVETYTDKYPTNATVAIEAFVVAVKCQPDIDADLRQKLSQIYSQLHAN